jgi:dTDP-4-dehydrorhamnose 3,5-epimerase/CDP-3, 6-dideoxy-D-glycero-D-glycero-4-hexulose-5-epimerase
MKINKTALSGVYIVDELNLTDDRGLFVKNYNCDLYNDFNIDFSIKESFYSVSNKNVIRGMHFQIPPYDHDKLVTVISGSILDIIVDIRKNSPTYGQFIKIELNGNSKKTIFIKSGFAHGFLSLENDTIVLYQTSREFNQTHDFGICFDSFGFSWNVDNPIISKKDLYLPSLKEFDKINPFRVITNE